MFNIWKTLTATQLLFCMALVSGIAGAQPNVQAFIEKGRQKFDQGKWDDARADFDEALKLNSNSVLAYRMRGLTYLNQRAEELEKDPIIESKVTMLAPGEVPPKGANAQYAIIDFSEALALDKNDHASYYYRASAYRLEYDFERAALDYEKFISLFPSFHSDAHFRDADVQLAQVRSKAIVQLLAQANFLSVSIAGIPDERRMRTADEDKKYDAVKPKVIAGYLKAARMGKPQTAKDLIAQGRIFDMAESWNDAITAYSEALKLTPTDRSAIILRASDYNRIGQAAKAITEMNRVLAIKDDSDAGRNANFHALLERAKVYRRQTGKIDDAFKDISLFLKAFPKYGEALYERGLIYISKGDKPSAVADLIAAGNDPFFYHRAQIQLDLLNGKRVIRKDFPSASNSSVSSNILGFNRPSTGEKVYYVGDISSGKANGHGKGKSPTGEYEGTWKENEPDGKGKMIFASGDSYDGEWLAGKMTGLGTYTWKNGDKYVGLMLNGVMYGKGTYYYRDGRTLTGYWRDGKYIGTTLKP